MKRSVFDINCSPYNEYDTTNSIKIFVPSNFAKHLYKNSNRKKISFFFRRPPTGSSSFEIFPPVASDDNKVVGTGSLTPVLTAKKTESLTYALLVTTSFNADVVLKTFLASFFVTLLNSPRRSCRKTTQQTIISTLDTTKKLDRILSNF